MSTGTTAGGLPYPNDDDPLRQGAQRIRELAAALETRWASRRTEVRNTAVTTNQYGVAVIGFATAFAGGGTGVWVAGLTNGNPGIATNLIYSLDSPAPSAGGFYVRVVRPDGSAQANTMVWVCYVAQGPM